MSDPSKYPVMDALEGMKADLVMMREEKICMEARIISAEGEIAEMKRMLSEYKAMQKLAGELLVVVIEAGGDNVDENNIQNLDEETKKSLIEEAMKDFTEWQNEAQSRGSRSADGGNGEVYNGSSGDITILNLDDGTNINIVKDAGGGNNGGHGGGQAE